MPYAIFGLVILLMAGYMVLRWLAPRSRRRPVTPELPARAPDQEPVQEVDPELVRQVRQFQSAHRPSAPAAPITRSGGAAEAMMTVRVELGRQAYDVLIGPGLLEAVGPTARACAAGQSAFIITDSNVGPLYADRAAGSLRAAGYTVHVASFPADEPHKTLATASSLFDDLFAAATPPDRSSVVVALGGGVVGDVAGFVAATLLRGVPFIQAPTTLLADVDSSVGGKTGVDHAAGKNLIGAFHQPRAVCVDTRVLATLPAAELAGGLAECVKHGIIRDASLIDWLEQHAGSLRPDSAEPLGELIARNVAIKAAVVAADEREAGERAHLNFGHTIGHAIEAERGFGGAGGDYLRHGHCVALGMVAANHIAVGRGRLTEQDAQRIEALLGRLHLPVRLAGLDADHLLAIMRHDKKSHAGRLRFILPARRLGAVQVVDDVSEAEIRAAIEYIGS